MRDVSSVGLFIVNCVTKEFSESCVTRDSSMRAVEQGTLQSVLDYSGLLNEIYIYWETPQ